MTEAQARTVIVQLVVPTLTRTRIIKEKGFFQPDPYYQSAFLYDVKTASGNYLRIASGVEVGDDHSVRTLMSWLKEVWYIQYTEAFPDNPRDTAASYAWGASRDREILMKNGLRKYLKQYDGKSEMTLEEAIAFWQKASQ